MSKKNIYNFSDTEGWNNNVLFFDSEESLAEYFIKTYPIYTNWDEMEDSELEERIDELDEHSEDLVFWEFS